jgi:tRNA(Ile)-lysidine synthase
MHNNLQRRVLETVERHKMIVPGDRVGVGVSGGADSVALLYLLAELRAQLGIGISILHFNHQLRGAEADEDERFVEALAAEFHLDFESGRADVAGEARRQGWNLEDAARRLRYQFFASASASRGLRSVAVAHTAEDQAETVLAHLLRGTGLAGLAGIYPVAGLTIRPLLEAGREELREYLRGLGRAWREDSTNADTSRMRARIRHQLLPVLRRDFEPLSVTRLARLAGLAREEETFWRALEDERLRVLVTRDPSGNISLTIQDLLSPLPMLLGATGEAGLAGESMAGSTLALTRRLVRRIAAELLGNRHKLTARHVEDVLDLAGKSRSGSRIDLPGIVVRKIFDRLIFSATSTATASQVTGEFTPPSCEFEYAISLADVSKAACIVVPEIRRRFDLKRIDWPSAWGETNSHRGALALEKLHWPLVLRNWRRGDSYRPQGHQRARKVKRLFLESRVPQDARAGWPVMTSGGNLIWASGYPVAQEFAPSSSTQTGLLIVEEDLDQTAQET